MQRTSTIVGIVAGCMLLAACSSDLPDSVANLPAADVCDVAFPQAVQDGIVASGLSDVTPFVVTARDVADELRVCELNDENGRKLVTVTYTPTGLTPVPVEPTDVSGLLEFTDQDLESGDPYVVVRFDDPRRVDIQVHTPDDASQALGIAQTVIDNLLGFLPAPRAT